MHYRTALKAIIITCHLFALSTVCIAQGDDCNTATPLGTEGTFPFNTATASTSGFNGSGTCGVVAGTLYKDVFWQWTAPSSGNYSINTFGSSFDTQMSIHSGTGCSSTCLEFNDQANHGNQSEVILTGISANDTYLIQVGGFANYSGAGSLTIQSFVDPCNPATDDPLEDNDQCTNPVSLGIGSYTGLHVTRTDSDYYEITIPVGGVLTLQETFDSYYCDYNLWESDCSTALVSGAPSTFSYPNIQAVPQSVIIEAYQWTGSSNICSDYDFDLSFSADPCFVATDDAFEENDTCLTASPISPGSFTGLFVSTADPDYFEMIVPAGEVIQISETYDSNATTYRLMDSDCLNHTFAHTFGEINWANETGTSQLVTLEVTQSLNASPGCSYYAFDVSTYADPCQPPTPDSFEPNNSCTAATPISDGTYTGLNVWTEDSDFFSFCIAPGDYAYCDAYFTLAQGHVTLNLWDAEYVGCGFPFTNNFITGTYSQSDNAFLYWRNLGTQDLEVVLQVSIHLEDMGRCNDYDLVITGATPCANTIIADGFCVPNLVNSTGLPTTMTATLGTGVGSDLHLEVNDGPPGQFGYFLIGTSVARYPLIIGDGVICLDTTNGAGIGRYNVIGTSQNSVGQFDAGGTLVNFVGTSTVGTGFDVPNDIPIPGISTIMAGDVWHFQLWHREPGGSSNFSNGLSVPF